MITKLTIVETESEDVFVNQGVEYALFDSVEDGELVLYLWANDNAVVIGRNQDAYSECNVDSLEADGGKLARRLSGGGAVYHDLGNLNFTFIAKSADFSTEINRKIILNALKSLGINAELTGRNDIEVDGAKVSGNAYYKKDGKEFHHGTMLITSSVDKVSKYLTPPARKFTGKAVKSVKSRVSNLVAFNNTVTKQAFAEAVKTAAKDAYPSAEYVEKKPFALGFDAIMNGLALFVKDEWRYGKKPDGYNFRVPVKLDGENFEIAMKIENDVIVECDVFSDGMDFTAAEKIKCDLLGKALNASDDNDENPILKTVRTEWYEI